MRKLADSHRILEFIRAVGLEAESPTELYLTGGATAVLLGWRATTIDVDIRFFPESDRLYRAIPPLKEKLEINIELASPADFIASIMGVGIRASFLFIIAASLWLLPEEPHLFRVFRVCIL